MDPTTPLPQPSEDASADPASGALESGVNITRLLAEAAAKSGILWIRLPGGSTHPAWFVWHAADGPHSTGPAAYVISGTGEQPLPWLPPGVELILRSKDTSARLLTIAADVREITPESPEWEAATAVLRPERLNLAGSPEEVDARWRAGCTIHVLTPHGRPHEQPGAYAAESGAAAVLPSRARTIGWRPWHWRGRPSSRRGIR